MTLQQKLDAMNTRKTSISINSHNWAQQDGLAWTCQLRYENDNNEVFEVRSNGADLTVDEAVNSVYEKFMAITAKAFETARPALLTHSTETFN